MNRLVNVLYVALLDSVAAICLQTKRGTDFWKIRSLSCHNWVKYQLTTKIIDPVASASAQLANAIR